MTAAVVVLGIAVLLTVSALAGVLIRGSTRSTIDNLVATQQGLAGQLTAITDQQAASAAATATSLHETSERLTKAVNDRLDEVQDRMGRSLQQASKETAESVAAMTERLSVIDKAQENITKLSTEVVGLQHILDDKQARGAFGEVQLEAIVEDALPESAYDLQKVLSNGKRADCLIHLPNPPGAVVIDAKFPLTAYRRMLEAESDAEKAQHSLELKKDVLTHIKAIAEKYIVCGETADSALMFLPSEAVYAELHAHHQDVIEASHHARVYIVSPTTTMATLTTMRAVLRDAEMRKQAGVIQAEVGIMIQDVDRLSTRVGNLRNHFGQAEKDIGQIEISAGKVSRRGTRIFELDLGESDSDEPAIGAGEPPALEAGETPA